MSRSPLHKGLLALGLVLVMVLAGYLVDLASLVHPQRLQDLLGKAGFLAPVFYMALMALAVVIAVIPSLPLDVAAGAFFGPLLGTLYSALGATAGAMASFLIARYVGREFIAKHLQGHINFCTRCSDRLLIRVIVVSRLLPFVSFDVVSYGAGLTKMSLKAFTLATFLGMLPLTLVYNYFGAVLVFNQYLAMFFGLLLVVLVFLVPRWIERYDLFSLRQYFDHTGVDKAAELPIGQGGEPRMPKK